MPYRLTENIYALDDKGVLRLTERVPVNADAFEVVDEQVRLVYPDGTRLDVTMLMATESPKFTLTKHEDPMHENCGPCEAGLPEEHSAPETKLKTVAKAILITLAAAVAAAFMRMC